GPRTLAPLRRAWPALLILPAPARREPRLGRLLGELLAGSSRVAAFLRHQTRGRSHAQEHDRERGESSDHRGLSGWRKPPGRGGARASGPQVRVARPGTPGPGTSERTGRTRRPLTRRRP